MTQLRFDEEAHRYFLGDRELLSVTTYLKIGDPKAHRFCDNPMAAERGKAVHKTCYLYIMGQLDEASIHPTVQPYFDAFLVFLSDIENMFGEKIFFYQDLCEKPQYHPKLFYAGTPDILARVGRMNLLIDIKSGVVPSWAGAQTAAYRYFPEIARLAPTRYALRLMNDGKYKAVVFQNESGDLIEFLNNYHKYHGGKNGNDSTHSPRTAKITDPIN